MQSWNVVFPEPGRAALLREPVAELSPTQILVRTRKSLISMGTELICYEGRFEEGSHWHRWIHYPFRPGYGSAGVVEAVGSAVDWIRPGERVASRAKHGELAWSEQHRAVKIPDAISDEDATWFGLACIVQNAVRRAEHELGDTVVIVGLGPLGQLAAQYARLSGAGEVIGIDPLPARLELAREWLTCALPLRADAALDAVQERTDGRGADVVYDVTGHPSSFPAALALPRRLGKVVLLGDVPAPSEQRLTPDVVTRGLRIIGAHDSNPPHEAGDHAWWTHRNMGRLFFDYLERGQMKVSHLVTHRYQPEQAAECYAALSTDRSAAMGVLFDWSTPRP